MIHDVIERFRYRFELWRRELREDLLGVPHTDPRSLREYSAEKAAERWSSRWREPKYREILSESTWRSVFRGVGVYFGIIIIAAQVCRIVASFFPSTRYALAIILIVFIGLWTWAMVISTFDLVKARKRQRAEDTISSNQSLQPTAGRSDV
jgi:hypothetical protein